ncbi:MAG: hypothetical protein QOI95_3099 [Acidimicrobiaceae bacterium]|jgi:hypothetical protein
MHRRTVLGLALTLLVSCSMMFGAESASAAWHNHCVVSAIGQRSDGELITSSPLCYSTFAEAMNAVGVDTTGISDVSPAGLAATGRLKGAATFIIGIHYDGYNWTGASFSVTGSNCSGGWLNVAPSWNDRISSTYNGCPRIRHFWNANLNGTWQDTTGSGGNLSVLDNQTTSIQYLT